MKNLREFLGYLEKKGIIAVNSLDNKQELNTLVKDLVQLDLTKFCDGAEKPQRPDSGLNLTHLDGSQRPSSALGMH